MGKQYDDNPQAKEAALALGAALKVPRVPDFKIAGKHDHSLVNDPAPPLPPVAPGVNRTTQETTMSYVAKKQTIVGAQILSALAEAAGSMTAKAVAKATGMQEKRVTAMLSYLKKQGTVSNEKIDRVWHWKATGAAAKSNAKKGAKPAKPAMVKRAIKKTKKLQTARVAKTPKNGNGTTRFGYFSDGSLQIDCQECKGILKQEDLAALRDFTRKFEKEKRA